MANKKPIALYNEGGNNQLHDVAKQGDVIDAAHIAVLPNDPAQHPNQRNAIEVIERDGGNFLYTPALHVSGSDNVENVRLASAAVSPHMAFPQTEKPAGQFAPAPLAEPKTWGKISVRRDNGDEYDDYLVPVYALEAYKKAHDSYTGASGFSAVTMEHLGTLTAPLVEDTNPQLGGVMKFTSQGVDMTASGTQFVNADLELHYINGGMKTHRGPVTLDDLCALARTGGHYLSKAVLVAKDTDALPNPTPEKYKKATLLWATDVRLKDKMTLGGPTLFINTARQFVLRWGDYVDYDTSNKYVVISII